MLIFCLSRVLHERNLQAEEIAVFGYLDSTRCHEIQKAIEESHEDFLYLGITSAGGDEESVLILAKELYQKRKDGRRVACRIIDKALGASAIIPFVCQQIDTSPVVSWGAIRDVSNEGSPLNVLRSRIQGMIDPNLPNAKILAQLVDAMSDPSSSFDIDGVHKDEHQTLVLNRLQLEDLKLISSLSPFTTLIPDKNNVSGKLKEQFDKRFKESFRGQRSGKIGWIEIGGKTEEISDATWIYVRSALKYYSEQKIDALVVDLNTPGGEVFAAERISDALKVFNSKSDIPVIAFIDNWAVSAGAMIAYSCPFIVASKDAIMGAAMPITMTSEGMKEAPEKINSALRTDFASRAEFYGRNPALAEAMVDPDTVVVKRGDQIIKLASMDDIRRGGVTPDEIISAKGKLLTLTAQKMYEFGVADVLVEPSQQTSYEDLSSDRSLIDTSLKVLPWPDTIMSDHIDPYRMDWQTRFVALLAQPFISSLLVMGLMIAIYMEFSSAGFGIAGLVGLICLFFLGLTSFSQEAISWLEVLLLLFGLLLVAIEVFMIPTFGLLGILGGFFSLAGIIGIILPGISSIRFEGTAFNAAGDYVMTRLIWISGAILVSFVLMIFMARPMKRRLELLSWLVLKRDSQPSLQVDSSESHIEIGSIAQVASTLRPAGKVEINGRLIDAISSGEFIDEGTKVRILEVQPGRVVVGRIIVGPEMDI